MATLTQDAPNFSFIVSEANGFRSRDQVTAGNGTHAIKAGALVRNDAGTWVECAAADEPEGLLCEAIAATENALRTVLARDAEVNKSMLVRAAGASPAEIDAQDAALTALGIILR